MHPAAVSFGNVSRLSSVRWRRLQGLLARPGRTRPSPRGRWQCRRRPSDDRARDQMMLTSVNPPGSREVYLKLRVDAVLGASRYVKLCKVHIQRGHQEIVAICGRLVEPPTPAPDKRQAVPPHGAARGACAMTSLHLDHELDLRPQPSATDVTRNRRGRSGASQLLGAARVALAPFRAGA